MHFRKKMTLRERKSAKVGDRSFEKILLNSLPLYVVKDSNLATLGPDNVTQSGSHTGNIKGLPVISLPSNQTDTFHEPEKTTLSECNE